MSIEAVIALSLFALVTSITPGPSNFMLLASGANFGFARTVPQVFGITTGFVSLLIAMGLGLGAVLTAAPAAHVILKAAGGSYLLYLAWRIGMSRAVGGRADSARPMATPLTMVEAAGFQWVNPKAWVVAATTMAVYTNPDAPFLSLGLIVAVFSLVNMPSLAVWVGFGLSLRSFLADPLRLKWFNIAMALALVASLAPLLA
jgi:threonine/homoserine/homoserine lactone efflux protein